MRLTFLGSGTSQGVPHIGCLCPVCRSDDPRNIRTRTSALLQVADQTILIDAGPDFRAQALAFGLLRLDAVLLTHDHFDHIGGLDDLRPLTEKQGAIPIYGNAFTLANVRRRFDYAFAERSETSKGSTRPLLTPVEIDGPFSIGRVPIIPFDVLHGSWTITGYRIGRLAYITDASSIPPASLALLEGLDVLVLNALRFKPHPNHFSLEEALGVVADLHPRQTFLVHMNHDIDHARVSATLPPDVQLAYDGLCVDIGGLDDGKKHPEGPRPCE